jgi:hypothetical protein
MICINLCFSTYQYTWGQRHCFCGNVAFSETAKRQDSSFIKHIGRHLGLTYVSRGIIVRAPQTTSQVVSPFCARGFTYQSLSPSLPALARSILRCNLPKVVIVSSFVGWLNFIGLAWFGIVRLNILVTSCPVGFVCDGFDCLARWRGVSTLTPGAHQWLGFCLAGGFLNDEQHSIGTIYLLHTPQRLPKSLAPYLGAHILNFREASGSLDDFTV